LATEGDGVLAANLRAERIRRGYTQRTLGGVLELGRGTVASIETGKVVNPGVYTLYRIAVALGVPMEDLMGVQRVTNTTKGRSRVRELERQRRAEENGLPTVGEIVAEIAARGNAIKADPYEMPDPEDWAMMTDPVDLPLKDAIRAGDEYAEEWGAYMQANTHAKMAGGVVFGMAVGAVWMARRVLQS
jgi:transcriptional regulator with XRE-family HTH domain